MEYEIQSFTGYSLKHMLFSPNVIRGGAAIWGLFLSKAGWYALKSMSKSLLEYSSPQYYFFREVLAVCKQALYYAYVESTIIFFSKSLIEKINLKKLEKHFVKITAIDLKRVRLIL